jgi:chloride channel 3/4/5
MFQVKVNSDWTPFELVPFMFLGVLGGLYGTAFVKSLYYFRVIRKKTRISKYPITEVMVITFLTGLINSLNSFTK